MKLKWKMQQSVMEQSEEREEERKERQRREQRENEWDRRGKNLNAMNEERWLRLRLRPVQSIMMSGASNWSEPPLKEETDENMKRELRSRRYCTR